MPKRCKNPLEGVVSYTSAVGINNLLKNTIAGGQTKENLTDAIGRMAIADFDWSDNKPDGMVDTNAFSERVRKLMDLSSQDVVYRYAAQIAEATSEPQISLKEMKEPLAVMISDALTQNNLSSASNDCVMRSQYYYPNANVHSGRKARY